MRQIGTEEDDVQASEVSAILIELQYDNLILDEMQIERLTQADGQYLGSFNNLTRLSLNQTHLKSLANFPKDTKL